MNRALKAGLSLLTLLAGVFLAVAGITRGSPSRRQTLEIYSPGTREGRSDARVTGFLERLRGAEKPEEEFIAKATVTIKKRPARFFTQSADLVWGADAGNNWSFFPQSPLNLSKFDQLRIAYRDLSQGEPCIPSLELTLLGSDPHAPKILEAHGAAPPPIRTIDAAGARWRPKEPAYVLRRIVGLAPDDDWRYAQYGEYAVIQGRLRQDLTEVEEVSIVLRGGMQPTGVNLRVKLARRLSPGALLEFGEDLPGSVDAQGSRILRIKVRQALRERFGTRHPKAFLTEIQVFMRGDKDALAQARVVRKIGFHHAPLAPLGRVENTASDRKWFVLDLREAEAAMKTTDDLILLRGRLIFRPADETIACGARVNGIRLGSFYDVDMPEFLDAGLTLLRRWGGLFISAGGVGPAVEWPRIVGHAFFGALRSPGHPLSSDMPFTSARTDATGLSVKGFGRSVSLHWPISAVTTGQTYFFLRLEEGANQVARATLSVDTADGRHATIGFLPDRPVLINGGASRIRGLRLTLALNKSPYSLKFAEMALFRPVMLTPEQALDERLPGGRTLRQDFESWDPINARQGGIAPPSKRRYAVGMMTRPVQFTVDRSAFRRLISGHIEPREHPYLQLTSITIEPRRPLAASAWQAWIDVPGSARFSRSAKGQGIIAALCLSALLWIGLKGGRGPRLFALSAAALKRVRWNRGVFGLSLALALASYASGFSVIGALALIFALRVFVGLFRIYERGGTPYFASAFLLLSATALLSLVAAPIAEQAALVAYYCLALGLVRELVSHGRQK